MGKKSSNARREYRAWRHVLGVIFYRNLRVLEGLTLLFFSSCLLILGMFILGSFQQFLPETQLMLLTLLRVSSFLSVVSNLYYVLLLVAWMMRRRRFAIPRLLIAVIGTAIGIALFLGVRLLSVFLEPVT
jgi:uncharacterized BrkB/YihY/UPF0761 family membrane protein